MSRAGEGERASLTSRLIVLILACALPLSHFAHLLHHSATPHELMSDATSPGVAASSLVRSLQLLAEWERSEADQVHQQRHRVVKEKEQQQASKRAQQGLPPLKRRPSPVFGALKWLVLVVVLSGALSRTATGTWLWGYEGKYSNLAKVSLVGSAHPSRAPSEVATEC